jgi:hypothetical protein
MFGFADTSSVFTFHQEGNKISGSVEGGMAGDNPVAIEEGRIDGNTVSFKVGMATYKGALSGDQLQLERSFAGFGRPGGAGQPGGAGGAGFAVGPPPPGTDPSMPQGLMRRQPPPLILRRVGR